jgi:hypothetical protein
MTHEMNAETSDENQCQYDAITSMDAVHVQNVMSLAKHDICAAIIFGRENLEYHTTIIQYISH